MKDEKNTHTHTFVDKIADTQCNQIKNIEFHRDFQMNDNRHINNN
jgi:hypothetical protein